MAYVAKHPFDLEALTPEERLIWWAHHQAWVAELAEKRWQEKDPVEYVHPETGHSVWIPTHWPDDSPVRPDALIRLGYELA